MPRPRKCRKVCHFPQTLAFVPVGNHKEKQAVILTVDEYEAIRLIDKEGFSQEQCSEYMKIARTTVQQIYTTARKKLADVLVDGLPLRIEGGNYQICDGRDTFCNPETCFKQAFSQQYEKPKPPAEVPLCPQKTRTESTKGKTIMRIAVTYEDGQIFQHFGHTEQFKIYDIEAGKVIASEIVDTNGSGHGALAGVLGALKADALICGGIGGGARMALDAAGIKLYGGVSGDADQAVTAFLAGNLDFNPDVQCSHHGDHHHHDSTCGEHGCGRHNCEH